MSDRMGKLEEIKWSLRGEKKVDGMSLIYDSSGESGIWQSVFF
jgi:hypothetical protein